MIVIGRGLANGEIPCSSQANALLGNGTNGDEQCQEGEQFYSHGQQLLLSDTAKIRTFADKSIMTIAFFTKKSGIEQT